jgi:hypothetical protein
MNTPAPPFMGVDLGQGGGPRAVPLPCDPTEIVLITANPNTTAINLMASSILDIWGLHPLLTVAVAFGRTRNPNVDKTANYTAAYVTATIVAYTLRRTGEGVVRGAQLPATLFTNGGVLGVTISALPTEDGCELVSAAQGVRFEVTATKTSAVGIGHDIVASIQAKQTVPIGCRALADLLVSQLTVTIPDPVGFVG